MQELKGTGGPSVGLRQDVTGKGENSFIKASPIISYNLPTRGTVPESTKDENDKLLLEANQIIYKSPNTVETLDEEAERIIRVQYAKQLCEDLRHLSDKIKEPGAAMYVSSFLKTVKLMRDISPFDPYLEIIVALNDAMIYKNQWIEYVAEQYKAAREVLIKYADQRLDSDTAMKAIMILEKIGFDTTPFEIDFEEQDQIEE